ncbi:hypothetical protein FF3_00724 [Fretibacterium fastidiosum]|uniref:hypothetical protein n=3 Tax=Fretibacterium fastidiosum TaxID=651822 RepID=UPI0038FC2FEC
MSRVDDDATGVKGSGFHPDETRIYNILVCVSAILLLFLNIRSSMGKYEAFLVFGEEEKLTSLLIEWTTALCAEFYFSWTIYRGITLKWKRLGLLILFCLLCIGYVLTSIVLFAFFFDLREEGTSSSLGQIIVSILCKIFVFFVLAVIAAFLSFSVPLYNPYSYYDFRPAPFRGVWPQRLNIEKLSENIRGDVLRAVYDRRGLDENYLLTDREEFLRALGEIAASTDARGTAVSMESVNYKVLFDAGALRFILRDNVCYLDVDLNKTASLIYFSPPFKVEHYIYHVALVNEEGYFELSSEVSRDVYYTDKSLWDALFAERLSKAKPMGNCLLLNGPVLAVPDFKHPDLVTMRDDNYWNDEKWRILDNVYIPLVVFLNVEPFPCVRVP